MWNCSCIAYSQLDLNTSSGCMFWYEDLIDMREIGQDGQDIYIRLSTSELDSVGRNQRILEGSLAAALGTVVLLLGLLLYIRKRKSMTKRRISLKSKIGQYGASVTNQEDSELPFFDYSAILKATDNFSNDNKVGEGGFGPVFKGTLEDGQEIAVKCLSSTSSQGIFEFKNESIFIAKLQHRNLVRLLGCCTQENQNMLIYEYMSNKSLDVVLFGYIKEIIHHEKEGNIRPHPEIDAYMKLFSACRSNERIVAKKQAKMKQQQAARDKRQETVCPQKKCKIEWSNSYT